MFGGAVMDTLVTLLVLLVPLVLVVRLLVFWPHDRDPILRAAPAAGRRDRVYQRARIGRTRNTSTVDGRPTGFTIEPVGVVVPEVVMDPAAMVPAAAQAVGESKAMAAAEESPAFQAAAYSPAAQAAAGTPLAELMPMRHDS